MGEQFLAAVVSDEEYERLLEIAARKGKTVAEVVAEAVHVYLLLEAPAAPVEPRLVRIHEHL